MDILTNIVMGLVPMILSLTVHEFAHAWSAYMLGDDTAAREGRMTLNPISHIDPIGTLLVPVLPLISGGQFTLFGWAKPVPVSPFRFNRTVTMRNGMIITAMAGPLSNLLIAFIASGFLAGMEHLNMVGTIQSPSPFVMLLYHLIIMNAGLAVFNMFPIPPLDGSRLLPLNIQEKLANYSLYIMLGLLLLINVAHGVLAKPIIYLVEALRSFWSIFF